MDRLADRADRLRKFLDAVAGGHIARLEMHLGHAAVITRDEAQQNFGQKTPLFQAHPAHDAEIDGAEAALRIDEQIARMHIGMEKPVAQRVAQEGLDHHLSEPDPVMPCCRNRIQIIERDPVDPFHRQHIAGGAIPIDFGHAEFGIIGDIFGHFGQGRRFKPQIHFHGDRTGQRVDHLAKAQTPRFDRQQFGLLRRIGHGGQIALEAGTHARTQHFDGDFAAIQRFGTMDLRDGGGGDRLAETAEHRIQRLAESTFDHRDRNRPRESRQAILQAFEIARHADTDDIGAGGQKLADLDIARAKAGQRDSQTLGPAAQIAPFDQAAKPDSHLHQTRGFLDRHQSQRAFARQHITDTDQTQDGDQGKRHIKARQL